MDAIPLLNNYYQGVIKSLKTGLSLKTGEVLSATVTARLEAARYELQIRGQRIQAASSLNLKTGEVLQLRVDQAEPQALILKLMTRASAGPRIDESQLLLEQARVQLLKQALPRQQSLQPVFRQLHAMSLLPSTLPDKLQDISRTFIKIVQSYQHLSTPQQVRQAILSSGLFLESRLARQVLDGQTARPAPDIKSILLQLGKLVQDPKPATAPLRQHQVTGDKAISSTIKAESGIQEVSGRAADRQLIKSASLSGHMNSAAERVPNSSQSSQPGHSITPDPAQRISLSELRQQVDAGLSRLHVQQNNAVVSDQHPQPVWSMEIPVHDGQQLDVFKLMIQQDGKHEQPQETPGWMTVLEFDLDRLGAVQVRLGLNGEHIRASIHADKAETMELFEDNLGLLASRFGKAGLKVEELRCVAGCLSLPSRQKIDTLVDIQL